MIIVPLALVGPIAASALHRRLTCLCVAPYIVLACGLRVRVVVAFAALSALIRLISTHMKAMTYLTRANGVRGGGPCAFSFLTRGLQASTMRVGRQGR